MANAQDLLLAKYAVKGALLSPDVLQDCLREQQQLLAAGQRLPLAHILIRRRVVTAESVALVLRTVEATTFACARCRASFPFPVIAASDALACPHCRGPLTILREDGEAISERLNTGRRPRQTALAPTPVIADTRPDSTSSRGSGSSRSSKRFSAEKANVPETFGAYEILSELGRGGMGIVYKARHPALDRVVALKVLIAGGMASGTQVKRFQREAELAGKLRHPGIVGIHDVGQIGDRHYFTMDFVEGRPLNEKIKARDLGLRQAIEIARDVARALDHAHQGGVIHRDVKPANVIIDAEGRPRLTDFGLAREAEADESNRLTREGAAVGTPYYMSPEQARGDRTALVPASDVYSLAVVLFEMLTFELPFSANTQVDLIRKILTEDPPRPTSIEPAIDADVETIVLKALTKSPQARYRSAAEFAEDLDRYLRGEPIQARPTSVLERVVKAARRHRAGLTRAGVATVGLLVLTVVGGLALARMRELERQRELEAQQRQKDLDAARAKAARDAAEQEALRRRERAERALADATAAFSEADRLPTSATDAFQERMHQVVERTGECIAIDPRNARALLLRGRANETLRNFDEALKDFDGARDLDGTGAIAAEAGYRSSRLVLRMRREDQDARSRLSVVADGPANVAWRPLARAALLLMGNDSPTSSEEVLQHLELAKRLDPANTEAHYLSALAYMSDPRGAKVREALAALDLCLETARKCARPYALRARIRHAVGQRDRAEEDVKRALSLDPDEPTALLLSAQTEAQRGNVPDAIMKVRRVLESQRPREDPQVVLFAVQLHAAAGNLDVAVEYAHRAAELVPGNPEPFLTISRVYVERELLAQALRELEQGLDRCPAPGAQHELARTYLNLLLQAGRGDAAEEFAKKHLEREPTDPRRKLRLVTTYCLRKEPGDPERALKLLDELQGSDPRLYAAHQVRVQLLCELKREKEAEEFLGWLVKQHAEDADAWLVACKGQALLGRDRESLESARRAVGVDPRNAEARATLAQLELGTKNYGEASRHAQMALDLEKDNTRALNVMGILAIEQQRSPQKAVEYFQTALEVDPADTDAAYYLGVLFANQEKHSISLRVIEPVLKRIGEAVAPARLLELAGICYLTVDRAKDAKRVLLISIAKSKTAQSFGALGEALAQLGEHEAARVVLKNALQLDPTFQPAKRTLDRLPH